LQRIYRDKSSRDIDFRETIIFVSKIAPDQFDGRRPLRDSTTARLTHHLKALGGREKYISEALAFLKKRILKEKSSREYKENNQRRKEREAARKKMLIPPELAPVKIYLKCPKCDISIGKEIFSRINPRCPGCRRLLPLDQIPPGDVPLAVEGQRGRQK